MGTQTSPPPGVMVQVEESGHYWDVSAVTLESMLKEKDFVLVNVHIPYEGELAETDLFIPFNEIDQNLDLLPSERTARIVLYCRTGSMSAIAARALVRLGYTDVWNLDGGFVGWQQAGYQVIMRSR